MTSATATRLSRRRFAGLVAGAALAARPAVPQALSREDELKAANQRRLSSATVLAKFAVPMDTEPAFAFRP